MIYAVFQLFGRLSGQHLGFEMFYELSDKIHKAAFPMVKLSLNKHKPPCVILHGGLFSFF